MIKIPVSDLLWVQAMFDAPSPVTVVAMVT